MTMPIARAVSHAGRRPPRWVVLLAAVALLLVSVTSAQSVAQAGRPGPPKPTIVLVHGAWADASSWNNVTERLQDDGYTVRAIANPLRSLATDAASVRAFLDTLTGPIVLVGHSYGGAVITNAATGSPNVEALVYINAFAPDEGQSPLELAGPDSALSADPLTVFDFVPAGPPGPTTDLYLKETVVFDSFATGLSRDDKALVWATQRAAAFGGLAETSGPPAWETIPSWTLIGLKDEIIPPDVQRAMAENAGATISEYNAGHLGLMSDSRTVTRLIERVARASVH
ncbi:alpha/beta fold hydrolase [Jiangella alkaliphila]|uniref:Pimeloyl-ACP methyl ester carboxylesterase n=1 Tax=Jiangella alkaliphila TaxID=419479 RepID=A0A1H2HQP3_9ACTN|nr:alpha/beta hydrolase [Jiangella alkaliphila]SDU33838.1 Pimeloyl-ACP methyl ester carboxylesterase [Jiangella alkaliphila]